MAGMAIRAARRGIAKIPYPQPDCIFSQCLRPLPTTRFGTTPRMLAEFALAESLLGAKGQDFQLPPR